MPPAREALLSVPEGSPYLVGGAVRDALLGREPVDYDLVTTRPRETAEAVQRATNGTLVALRDELALPGQAVEGYAFERLIHQGR